MTTLCKHVRLYYYVSSHGACQQLTSSHSSGLCGNKRIPTPDGSCYLDHFIAMGLGISSSHGKDSDLLCLWAAVSQRQGHLPVGGAVCGVGSGSAEKTTWIITFPQYVFIKVNLLRVGGFHTFFPFSSLTHRSHLCVANRQKEKHSIDCQTCFSPHSLNLPCGVFNIARFIFILGKHIAHRAC